MLSGDRLRQYDLGILQSAFVSTLWAAIWDGKGKARPGVLDHIASETGIARKEIDKIFRVNGRISLARASAIASALNLQFNIRAVHNKTGEVFTPNDVNDNFTGEGTK